MLQGSLVPCVEGVNTRRKEPPQQTPPAFGGLQLPHLRCILPSFPPYPHLHTPQPARSHIILAAVFAMEAVAISNLRSPHLISPLPGGSHITMQGPQLTEALDGLQASNIFFPDYRHVEDFEQLDLAASRHMRSTVN